MKACLIILVVCFMSCKGTKNEVVQDELRSQSIDTIKEVDRIAFGSCNDEDDPQDYWKTIGSTDPDLWIWMGDNIYGDSDDMTVMKRKYDRQKSSLDYQNFIKKIPIIGTWDDHDYGINDGNKTYAKKEESKMLMLDFLDVDKSREVYRREGAYDSFIFGSVGQSVQIVLLDTRSFQDVLEKDPSGKQRYLESEGDILGEAQWAWLNNLMSQKRAELTIIVSSIQFLAEDHKYEKWANFPNAKERLMNLFAKAKQQNVIILSGDRHLAEISKLSNDEIAYPLYDITSSGLTHSYEKANEENKFRVSKLSGQRNFGQLIFDWKDDTVDVETIINGIDGNPIIQHTLGTYKK